MELAQERGAEVPWARRPAAPLVGRLPLRERVQALRELVSESREEEPLESAAARAGLAQWPPPAWRRPWAEVPRVQARLPQARVPHAGMRGSER